MDELDANQIVELFEKNVSARKRLAELIVIEPDIRLAIINAVLRDVATKDDIEKLRIATKEDIEKLRVATKEDIEILKTATKEDIEKLRKEMQENIEKLRIATKEDINKLDGRINGLDKRVVRLEGQMNLFIKLFIAFNLPILLGIVGILLKLVFS